MVTGFHLQSHVISVYDKHKHSCYWSIALLGSVTEGKQLSMGGKPFSKDLFFIPLSKLSWKYNFFVDVFILDYKATKGENFKEGYYFL